MARRRLAPAFPAGSEENVPRAEHSAPAFPPAGPIARVAAEAAGAAALDEIAETLRRAREDGRLVLDLPLDAIAPDHLARDRVPAEDEEMAALRESLRAHGQRTPIEVTPLVTGAGGALPYGLISGWRRLTALQALHAETGEARFATVQALVRRPETAADAYVTMVEENEIRLGLSHYERARVAARATERGVFPSEKAALLALFATASRAEALAHPRLPRDLPRARRRPALPGRICPSGSGLPLSSGCAPATARASPRRWRPKPRPAPRRGRALLAGLVAPARPAPAPAAAFRPVAPGIALASRLAGTRLTLTLTGIDAGLAAEVEAAVRRRWRPPPERTHTDSIRFPYGVRAAQIPEIGASGRFRARNIPETVV